MKLFYKPTFKYLFTDIIMLMLWITIILAWFPFSTQTPFEKYSIPALYYVFIWGVWSYLLGRYQPLSQRDYYQSTNQLLYTSLVVLLLFHVLIFIYFFNKYSHNLLYLVTVGEFSFNYILLVIYFSYRYAVKYEDLLIIEKLDETKSVSLPGVPLDEKSLDLFYATILHNSGEKVLNFLQKFIRFDEGKAMVFASKDPGALKYLAQSQFSTIIQLEKMNSVTGINKMLTYANNALPENGIFVCNFQTKSTHKRNVLKSHSKGINYLFYSFDFIFKRVFPKLYITRWFYYIFSGCKNRVLSKAEVLGRLYYCGFKIEMEKKIGDLTYVFARRTGPSQHVENRTYGPLIRLNRLGKNSEYFYVYKMRTMHPYSEFLQAYIYEKNSLQDGGKFNKDIRITTLGKYMRKFWIDELPMIINLLKGEMKLVGVRPLSSQYFNLYSKELQEKRVKFKPGLLPPFYADMPKTLDEIQASELKYLNLCEEKNQIFVDMYYFLLILKNILIKNARSA